MYSNIVVDCLFKLNNSPIVLTVCQLQGIPGAAAALYTSSSESTSEQVAGFTPLLDIPITTLTRRVSDSLAIIM